MNRFSGKHPIVSVIIVFVISILLGGAVGAVLVGLGFDRDVSGAIGRILIGIVFLAINYRKVRFGNSLKGFVIMLPALLLALYKIPYHFVSGGGVPNPVTIPVILIGLAPAVFEEILFRGIFVYNLKKKYDSPVTIMLISALVFSLVHLTNIIGMDLMSLLIQLIMAFVAGVVFGAIYLKTEDLVSIIIAHFAIDVTSGIFYGGNSTPLYFIVILVVIWIFEIVYGFLLVRKVTGGDLSTEVNEP